MRNVSKGITVGSLSEPDLEGVQVGASERIWVGGWGSRPKVRASSEGLHPLQRSVNLFGVLDWSDAALGSAEISSGLDVPVAVVADVEEVLASGWQAGIDVVGPCDVLVQIGSSDSICVTGGSVDI